MEVFTQALADSIGVAIAATAGGPRHEPVRRGSSFERSRNVVIFLDPSRLGPSRVLDSATVDYS